MKYLIEWAKARKYVFINTGLKPGVISNIDICFIKCFQ